MKDAEVTGAWLAVDPDAAGRLETKKAGLEFFRLCGETTDEPSCLKTARFRMPHARKMRGEPT